MDSSPVNCTHCGKRNHSVEYCNKKAADENKSPPETVRIQVPGGGEWKLTKASQANAERRSILPSSVSVNQGAVVVEGFPGIYIRLRGLLRQGIEIQYVAGQLNIGERYGIVQGCLYTRTKQRQYQGVVIHSLEYTHYEMFSKPIPMTVLGYNYFLMWTARNIIVVPQDEATWLYEYWSRRNTVSSRPEPYEHNVDITSVKSDDGEGEDENIGVVQTPSEIDDEEAVGRMSVSEIRRLVMLGRRGRQLAIGLED